MKVNVESFADVDTPAFSDFCDAHGLTVTVHERSKRLNLPRWWADTHPMLEIRKDGILEHVGGDGDTPEEAIQDMARRITGHRLLKGGYSGVEITAPNDWTA